MITKSTTKQEKIMNASNGMEWRNPPVVKNGSPGQVRRFVETLKSNAGVWAVYSTGNTARTGHSKAQQYKTRSPGTEWLVRIEGELGGYTVFGRWVG
jgi:hypothetical protein